jgi:positive regulator of sigma E activity
MIEADAVVVRLEGEHAWVRAEGARSACGACARKDGCHRTDPDSLLDGVAVQSGHLLRLPNTIHAHPGDVVVIRAADGLILRAVWLAYGMPLFLALVGATALDLMVSSEFGSIAGALLGLSGGYFLMRRRGLDSGRSGANLSITFKSNPLSFHEG